MTFSHMGRGADVVTGSRQVVSDPEPSSGVGPASNEIGLGGSTPSYPHRSNLVLGAFPSAVPCARLHARQVVWEWGLAALAEAVELIVSELVTNAVRASEGLPDTQQNLPTVQMRLHADHERVLIQVWDGNQQMPLRREPDLEADGGRGLSIVEAVSETCGAYRPEGDRGKVAWAVVAAE